MKTDANPELIEVLDFFRMKICDPVSYQYSGQTDWTESCGQNFQAW